MATAIGEEIEGLNCGGKIVDRCGLSPSGFRIQQVSLAFAGLVAILSALKFLVLTDWKRWKEAPMKQAFVLGTRSVLDTVWAIGTSNAAVALPG